MNGNVVDLKKINQSTLASVVVNTVIAVMKMSVGLIAGSHAMVIDGVHSFSDLLSDFFVLFVSKIAHEAPDENHPFGHGKIESFGTMALGGTLLVVAGAMGYDSLTRFNYRGEPVASFAIYFALISIVAKEFLFRYLIKLANEMNSDILKANAWHSRFDAFSSFVVLIGLLGEKIGLYWMDSVAGAVISLMIARVGIMFAWPAMQDLADTALPAEKINQYMKIIRGTPGVVDAHNLRTRKSAKYIFIDINIQVNETITVSEGHETATQVMQNLKNFDSEIADVTVHIDIENDMAYGHYPTLPRKRQMLRSEVEEKIREKWQDFGEDQNLIKKVGLHYLKDGIKVEIFLKTDGKKIPSELIQSVQTIPGLSSVIFWDSI